jgi:RecJ-like exonuclease
MDSKHYDVMKKYREEFATNELEKLKKALKFQIAIWRFDEKPYDEIYTEIWKICKESEQKHANDVAILSRMAEIAKKFEEEKD